MSGQQEKRCDRQNQVRCRTGQRDQRAVPFDIFEIPGIDRHRFAPAEMNQEKHKRPERVQVRYRIERQATLVFGGRISELVGCEGMRRLVETERQ